MKQKLAFFVILLAFTQTNAQKEDYVWPLGRTPNSIFTTSGGTVLNFAQGTPEASFFNILLKLDWGMASMGNEDGQLLFYSNGCNVINAQHKEMPNSDSLNTGLAASGFCRSGIYYPNNNGVLALPFPGRKKQYILFHIREARYLMGELLYSVVDMNLDGGRGDVTKKNAPLLKEGLADYLSAVRHGNGRDWWVLTYGQDGNRHYAFLLDSLGIHGPFRQTIGGNWNDQLWLGQSVFAPNGKHFVRANPSNGVDLFDFDRCSGILSNYRHLPLTDTIAQELMKVGVAFSPNGRYLYVSFIHWLYQYDLQAADVAASRQVVGRYDGVVDVKNIDFYRMALGPDGKIYMAASNPAQFLHVIHEPNAQGMDCRFEQHALKLPARVSSLPNFPNFRLYDFPNSPCDTLGIDGPTVAVDPPYGKDIIFSLSPNPAATAFALRFQAPFSGVLTLRDATGKVIGRYALHQALDAEIPVENVPNGLYFLSGETADGAQGFQRRVVVVH